jgi:presequence protease
MDRYFIFHIFLANDNTSYPFSTQNQKDYYNLMNVYLDSTLFPNLLEEDFLQEGFRVEYNEEKKLEFKGVVYNEMIGAMSSSQDYFSQKLQEALYPDTIYAFNSGGDPDQVKN